MYAIGIHIAPRYKSPLPLLESLLSFRSWHALRTHDIFQLGRGEPCTQKICLVANPPTMATAFVRIFLIVKRWQRMFQFLHLQMVTLLLGGLVVESNL